MRMENPAMPAVWINDVPIDGVIEAGIEVEAEDGGVTALTLCAARSDKSRDN